MAEWLNPFKELGLDSRDRKIMYELDVNARQSSAQIAKKLRLDKAVVNYRIKKLLDAEVILGFYTIIDTTKLGYEGYRLYLKFQNLDAKKEGEITSFIVKSPLTWWVGSIDGNWDMGVLLWVRNVYELKKFWCEFMEKYGEYVQDEVISVYANLYHFSYAFIYPGKVAEPAMQEVGSAEKVQATENEEKVLRVLAENARMPTVEIAEKTGLTPMVVKYAIKKMSENGVIKGFRVMFNLGLLNYTYYKVDVNISDFSRYSALFDFARAQPNVIYIDRTIGAGDLEMNLLVETHEQFHDIMRELKAKFPGVVRDYSYMIYSKIHKIAYYQH
ncbi:MAG: Lrp/AsnC family transcriptional regulator [Candidatus Diapherotrites archaeon]